MNIAEYIEERSIPEPNSGCWLWLNSVDKNGYGWASVKHRTKKAHRLAWEGRHGSIPDGMCVCHKCDNPGCVNVDHMWLGTNVENTKDRSRKGRSHRANGESQWMSRLTEAAVVDIRSSPETGRALARRYGVTFQTISDIRRGTRWKHLLPKAA
jgi:hypothetical protein